MILKNFVVFEGIDGAGTSTQISALKGCAESHKFFFTTEPTESPTGKFLRQILKGDVKIDSRTSAYLFAADRAEHLWGTSDKSTGIQEKCLSKIVVSDRYIFSSLAYQGVSCGEELPRLLNSPFPLPEILFFFEIEPEVSLLRIKNRDIREIFETQEFLKQTEERYKDIVNEYESKNTGMKIVRIDASLAPDKITKIILDELSPLLKRLS